MIESVRRIAGDRTIGAIEFQIGSSKIGRIEQTRPIYAIADRAATVGLRWHALDDIVLTYAADFLSWLPYRPLLQDRPDVFEVA